MRSLLFIISLFIVLGCENPETIEEYDIYNTVLAKNVTTYGIMASYLPYDRHYSDSEIEKVVEKLKDSLSKTKSLTYFLSNKLTVLDTLNPTDDFATEIPIVVESRPQFSKDLIDFSRIKDLEIARRLETSKKINDNEKGPVYLGSYDLSKPIFISKNKVVIRFEHHCGSKCGIGRLIYLQKTNGKWNIVDEKMIWIS